MLQANTGIFLWEVPLDDGADLTTPMALCPSITQGLRSCTPHQPGPSAQNTESPRKGQALCAAGLPWQRLPPLRADARESLACLQSDLLQDSLLVEFREKVGCVGSRHAEQNVATGVDRQEIGHVVDTCSTVRAQVSTS